jgi:DNA repair photolyase
MSPREARSLLKVVQNPPHRWQKTAVEWLEGPPAADLEIFEDASKTILAKNDSPDIPFTWSLNPYRGCAHGCAYCYARPSHEYLDFGAGTDFEKKLVIKPDAAALLEKAFDQKSWRGEVIAFSGNTDCYQPLEAEYGITRACLEVCLRYKNPVSVITKSAVIERDAALLAELARIAYCQVRVSIPLWDADVARAIEPFAPSPARRIKVIAALSKAGVPVGVNVAPVIPGLSDKDIPSILVAAREAGATSASHIMLRLPGPVLPVFEERIRNFLPLRAERILGQIEDCRGGKRNEPRFGARMTGSGARWDAIRDLFDTTARRLGYAASPPVPDPSPFSRPYEGAQGRLF